MLNFTRNKIGAKKYHNMLNIHLLQIVMKLKFLMTAPFVLKPNLCSPYNLSNHLDKIIYLV